MRSTPVVFIQAFLIVGAVAVQVGAQQGGVDPNPPNAPGQKPAFAGQNRVTENKSNVAFDVVTVAEKLENPWALTFLPDGKMLVTERPGRLRVVASDGRSQNR